MKEEIECPYCDEEFTYEKEQRSELKPFKYIISVFVLVSGLTFVQIGYTGKVISSGVMRAGLIIALLGLVSIILEYLDEGDSGD